MTDTPQRNPLATGYEFGGYRIVGRPDYDEFTLDYPALRMEDGLEVTIAEFAPLDLAQRVGDYMEPGYGKEEAFDLYREAFAAEFELLSGIDHPGVVATIGLFRHGGTSYRVQVRPRGASLWDMLHEGGATLSQREILEILDPLLDGLEALHAAGYMHTTVDDDAVVVQPDGSPVWRNMARLRTDYRLVYQRDDPDIPFLAGRYPAPELGAEGGKLGPAADIFSMASLLYRLAAGSGPDIVTTDANPDRPSSPASSIRGQYNELFLGAVDAGLRPDPTARPQSIADWRPMFRRERRKIL